MTAVGRATKDMKILVVEDEMTMRETLTTYLTENGFACDSVMRGEDGVDRIRSGQFAIAIVDLRLPGIDGIEVLKSIKIINPELPVIMITAYATVENAVLAIKEGAYDYLVKPFNLEELGFIIQKIVEHRRLVEENIRLREQLKKRYSPRNIIGNSQAMRRIFEIIESVADSSATVLIQGESGTGKELIARTIHYVSSRREKPFITINCGAIPEALMESELFGHEKGAFTGANKTKTGRFELAADGTFFLDEIGELSTEVQVDFLRVLQEREFRRVGGTELIPMEARIIASTNRDLQKEVHEGRFREDLFYRLNVVPIHVPPLRERQEDIPFLVRHFIDKHRHEARREVSGITSEALDMLIAYDWPGNVRELENAIERALVLGKGEQIAPDELPETIQRSGSVRRRPIGGELSLEEVERLHILATLEHAKWNLSETARILGITRVTLYNKIDKYGLRIKDARSSVDPPTIT
ncbi:MAG: sigma-54 dependent transcriptional regulator [candidate division WOR-3 bacterium]